MTLSRLQMEEMSHETIEGDSTCRTLMASGTFKVKKHADKSEVGRSYAITTIKHEASDASYIHDNKPDHSYYRNTFTCIPAETVFRPPVTHPKKKNGVRS